VIGLQLKHGLEAARRAPSQAKPSQGEPGTGDHCVLEPRRAMVFDKIFSATWVVFLISMVVSFSS
jgi:hypothetical protein